MKKLIEKQNIIIFEKTIHKIEVFEIAKIITQTSKKSIAIKFLNVILIIDYFINLICFDRFEKKQFS